MRRCKRRGCRHVVGQDRRSDAQYCSEKCQKAAAQYRRRQRRKTTAETNPDTSSYATNPKHIHTREDAIREIERLGYDDMFFNGEITQAEIARLLDKSESVVKRAFDEIRVRRHHRQEAEGWEMTEGMRTALALDLEQPDPRDEEACWAWAVAAAFRFLWWERALWVAENGRPWIRKEFHVNWVIEFMFAFATGGYLQILAPPRHGKSEVFTHLVVWFICRNPNIRVLWVGPNDDLVEERVLKMEEQLTDERLVRLVLPPGQSFEPPKRGSGSVWGKTKFKVACRRKGITGNTVTGIGLLSKMVSRNADMIVCDDPEDDTTTATPAIRKKGRHRYGTQLDSRKEEHTPFCTIGSRQHHEDLYSYNLQDPSYRHVIEDAHCIQADHDKSTGEGPDCLKDPDDLEAHTDCVLFPQVRSYRWLRRKQTGADARSDDEDESFTYDMVYRNKTKPAGQVFYTRELMEPSRNMYRTIGLEGIPSQGRRLIAGLDPGATKNQAAFLWAVTPIEGREVAVNVGELGHVQTEEWRYRRWMVDLENQVGGGTNKALELMEAWRELYGLLHWVIEDNALQQGFLTDAGIMKWKRRYGATIEGSTTQGANKYNPSYGIGAMSRLWRADLVDLPFGDEESRTKTGLYIGQCIKFVDDVESERRRKKDVHMASWFPDSRIRRWEREVQVEQSRVKAVASDYPASYSGINSFTAGMNRSPW